MHRHRTTPLVNHHWHCQSVQLTHGVERCLRPNVGASASRPVRETLRFSDVARAANNHPPGRHRIQILQRRRASCTSSTHRARCSSSHSSSHVLVHVPVASARDARHGLNFKTANRSSRRRRRRRRARRAALHRASGDGARASLRKIRRCGAHRASVEERGSSARARSVADRRRTSFQRDTRQTLMYSTLVYLMASMLDLDASFQGYILWSLSV